MFQYCQHALQTPARTFFYVSKESVEEISNMQVKRFSSSKPIRGTRDFHSFRIASFNEIEARNYSLQTECKKLIFDEQLESTVYHVNDCVAIKLMNEVNIGVIKNIINEEVLVEFYKMTKHGENYTFTWPAFKPIHAFLNSDIISKINELVPTSKSCRAYKLSDGDKLMLQSVK